MTIITIRPAFIATTSFAATTGTLRTPATYSIVGRSVPLAPIMAGRLTARRPTSWFGPIAVTPTPIAALPTAR